MKEKAKGLGGRGWFAANEVSRVTCLSLELGK